MNAVRHNACLYCDKQSLHGLTHDTCKRIHDIDGYLSVYYYSSPLQAILKNLKYRLVYDAFSEVFRTIPEDTMSRYNTFAEAFPACVLQPIPLHPFRLAKRGFNQAAVLAEYFHVLLGYEVGDMLVRVKNTLPQAQTRSRVQRAQNIQGAFRVRRGSSIRGADVILVDDVFTTGNTVREAARVCKLAGAGRVFVFSLAKG